MKKLICILLTVVLCLSITYSASASEQTVTNNGEELFSFYNNAGQVITIDTSCVGLMAESKVYVDGALRQYSIANADDHTINTTIYDLNNNDSRPNTVTSSMNGFITTVVHESVTNESIDVTEISEPTRYLFTEPVDNTGLYPSGYGDGYYNLGSYGGFYYAPQVYGYLFRKYTRTYNGETKYWSWSAGDTLSAISAYISLYGGPVSAIIGILVFTVPEVLAYNQAIELATYTYNYDYRVRINGTIYFTTTRNITYWRIVNSTTGGSRWEQKSFNSGYSQSNEQMVRAAIDIYLTLN